MGAMQFIVFVVTLHLLQFILFVVHLALDSLFKGFL
jgi:hypothetical protein